ncbi:hypothetical protein ABPG77_005381 [Micractinium sp. CCAP 211/92]
MHSPVLPVPRVPNCHPATAFSRTGGQQRTEHQLPCCPWRASVLFRFARVLRSTLPLLSALSHGFSRRCRVSPLLYRQPSLGRLEQLANRMVDTGALRTPGFWLRLVQLVFGIIAFAVIAEYSGWSRADFAIFCGVVTMLASLVLMACLILGISAVRGLPSLVYDGLFWIFWLACAAALSDSLASMDGWGWYGFGSSKSRLQASVAFSWLTWFSFIASIFFDVQDLRSGAGTGVSRGAAPDAAFDGAAAKGAAPAGAATVAVAAV